MRDVLLVIATMKLRGTTTPEGRMIWSAIDFIEQAAHKSHDAAKQHMRRLTQNIAGSKNYAFFKKNIVMMSLRRANGAAYSTVGLDLDGLLAYRLDLALALAKLADRDCQLGHALTIFDGVRQL